MSGGLRGRRSFAALAGGLNALNPGGAGAEPLRCIFSKEITNSVASDATGPIQCANATGDPTRSFNAAFRAVLSYPQQ